MPTLVGEQVPLAAHLLHTIQAWQQSQFGGQLSVHEETQTCAFVLICFVVNVAW